MKASHLIAPVVIEAGKIMTGAHDISSRIKEKAGTANFVTAYDVAVEDFLYDRLAKLFPEAKFIGEEDGANHAGYTANGLSFIIDPIDGTTNFIHGYLHSAVSVGLCEKGRIIAGVVLDPYQNELFAADFGEGATLNGEKIAVSERRLRDALVCFGTSPYRRELAEASFNEAKRLYLGCRDIRRSGSAALDLAYVACGRCDLFFELTLSPWDYAAGSLLVTEAGGRISAMDGKELPFDKPSSVLAANQQAGADYFAEK